MERAARHRPDLRPWGVPIGGLFVQRVRLYAFCRRCRHSGLVERETLRERFGERLGVRHPRVQRAMVCRACGARGADWRVLAAVTGPT